MQSFRGADCDTTDHYLVIAKVREILAVENAEVLVAATREIGLELSADKAKYMVMS